MSSTIRDTFSIPNLFTAAAVATGSLFGVNAQDEIKPHPQPVMIVPADKTAVPTFGKILATPEFAPKATANAPSTPQKEYPLIQKYLTELSKRSGLDENGKPTTKLEEIDATSPSLMLENLIGDITKERDASKSDAERKDLTVLLNKLERMEEEETPFGYAVRLLEEYSDKDKVSAEGKFEKPKPGTTPFVPHTPFIDRDLGPIDSNAPLGEPMEWVPMKKAPRPPVGSIMIDPKNPGRAIPPHEKAYIPNTLKPERNTAPRNPSA